jgi:putative heme transporter
MHDESFRLAAMAGFRAQEGALMADQPPPTPKPRSRARLALQVVGSLVLVAAIFYYLFQGIDLAQVWADIQAMTWLEDLTLLAAAVWNMATYSLVWMTVAPGLGFWRATMMSQSTAAVSSTVPWAGPVIGTGMTYSMFGQWGYSGAQTTTAVLVSGVWNSFAKLALPVLALALLALQGGVAGGRVVAGLVGIAGLVGAIVVFALILRSEDLARRFGLWASRVASRLLGLVRRPPVQGWEVATVRFRARTLALLGGRWGPITAATLVSHLSTYLVLLVALRHVGVSDAQVSWVQVLAWFAFARLLTAVPVTPAGLGLVEATLIGGLTGAGGNREQVTAAVLVYRALTWFLPILVGVVCLLWWRRSRLASQPATPDGPPAVTPGAAGATSTDRPGTQARDRQSWP